MAATMAIGIYHVIYNGRKQMLEGAVSGGDRSGHGNSHEKDNNIKEEKKTELTPSRKEEIVALFIATGLASGLIFSRNLNDVGNGFAAVTIAVLTGY